ncbi:MAG TPA: S8 family serine peptidase, partial [Acidimicrobiales bacterium]|nr:S8 family serine peptidase [Acidimicrobiales bacterium]
MPTVRVLARALAAVALVAAVPMAAAAAQSADDPVFAQGLQWGLTKVGAPAAWTRGTGAGVTIAVIDSGVDPQHEDLARKIVGQTSCFGTSGDPGRCSGSARDDNGHGTHVAGIAAAATNNGRGVAGVAPDAQLIAVRVLRDECTPEGCTATGTAGDVAAGIRWAVDHGADVLNLSLGGGTLQNVLGCAFCDAIEYAWSKGVITVIAAGNDALLPAGFGDEPAIVVTATNRDDGRASYSNSSSGILRTARWPVSAPGGEAERDAADCATGGRPSGILSTYWLKDEPSRHDQYACLAGTSMAAPHVAGGLAILRGQGLSPQAAVDRLLGTARDLGSPGRDASFGVGLIDLARAAQAGP